jgi:hypothetical protein
VSNPDGGAPEYAKCLLESLEGVSGCSRPRARGAGADPRGSRPPGPRPDHFLEAWAAEKGFGLPTRVFIAPRPGDEREILTFGFVDTDAAALDAAATGVVEQEAVRYSRIDEVIDSTELRAFYDLRCEHGLSVAPRQIVLASPASTLDGFGGPPPGS